MSELQLEELNSDWDETTRSIHPRFRPVNLPVIVATEVSYSLSSQWEIVKTLRYIALSSTLFPTMCEDAICKVPLNALHNAASASKVKEVPFLRHFEQQCSAEVELEKALKHASIISNKDQSPSKSLTHPFP
jgi:hypothetical protein